MDQLRFFCLRGFMKSGTNWVGSLLSSHESISCVGEFHWQAMVNDFQRNLRELPLYEDETLAQAARQNLETMIQQTMVDAAKPGASVIGDRTPHTIEPITIRKAPHISVVRDGRDVLVSRAFHLYNWPGVTGLFDRNPEMARKLEAFQQDPWYFQKHPEQLLEHEELVQASVQWWREHIEADRATVANHPDLPVHFVRYEDVHADTPGERRKMFEFLDVDPRLAASIDGRLQAGFGTERPNEFFRKGAIGDWKNYFTDQVKDWFKTFSGSTLIDLDYESSQDW